MYASQLSFFVIFITKNLNTKFVTFISIKYIQSFNNNGNVYIFTPYESTYMRYPYYSPYSQDYPYYLAYSPSFVKALSTAQSNVYTPVGGGGFAVEPAGNTGLFFFIKTD